jgi:N-acyl-D-amino-acid deacylase
MLFRHLITVTTTVLFYSVATGLCQQPPDRLDILIQNGKIVNGTGNPWFYADVGIVDDTIVAIGALDERAAARVIDAEGLVVSPGFIDVHTHVDDALGKPESSAILNYLIQGVTTVRPGADGSGSYKISETKRMWERQGIGTNAVLTIGFNELRSEVLEGNQLRSPTEKELETMKSAVRQAMREGAWGISTGIEYDGLNIYATTEEIIEVTKPVADFGGIYISHMRDEAAKIVDAVREIIRIGEETGVPVNVTHIKAAGTDNWGLMKEVVALINDVRARGIMITADQYPFLQGSPIDFITGLVDIPPDMDELAALDRSLRDDESRELRDRFVQKLQKALSDERLRERLRQSTYEKREADPSAVARWGWQDFRIKVAVKNAALLEKTWEELIEDQGRDGFDIVADLILDEPDILFASASQSPEDMRHALVQDWVMIGSDGGGFPIIEDSAVPVRAHPRSFASQSIALRKFVREEKLLTLEDAIRKMTSLPAQFLGMKDRGLLLEGFKADVVIFDPETIRDNATYADARKYATGVEYVIVGGQISVESGKYNGALNGKVLLKKGV